jgi:hypothetical protein
MGTTQSGSKLALSSRALPKRRHLPTKCEPDRTRAFVARSEASLPRPLFAPDEILDQVVGVGTPVGSVLRLEPEP